MSKKSNPKKRDKEGRRIRTLPPGAIAADLSKQPPNNSCHPKTLYVDEPFTCQVCFRVDVWTAAQQKWYYEVAKGSIYAKAKYCRSCWQRIRRMRDEQRKRSQAKTQPPLE